MATDFDLKSYLARHRTTIDTALLACLHPFETESRLLEAMRYSLMAGGKRLRPVLCLAACEAVEMPEDTAMPVACALEMIHTYSLIHDDLPAMDDDDTRRGNPTCHVAFDEATAILAGDALLTAAFQILAESPAPPETRCRVIALIASASGAPGMVEGQMRDMAAEGGHLSVDELRQLHYLKTGRLIEAATVSGALIHDIPEPQISALSGYARKIGLAFQVADDILNVEGDPVLMGKSVGTDAASGKMTFPALIGLDASRAYARELVEQAVACLSTFGPSADPLRNIAEYVITRKR